ALSIALVTLLGLFEYFALGEAIGHRAYRFWTGTCALVLVYAQWRASSAPSYNLAGGLIAQESGGWFAGGAATLDAVFVLFRFGVSRLARCSAGVYALGKRASLSPDGNGRSRKHCGTSGRPVGVWLQAQCGNEGLGKPASRSWRCARPGRCPYPGDSGCLVLLDPDLLAAILTDGKTLQFAPKGSGNLVKQLAILGSTGSIGRQCLAVVESLPGRFGVVALAAGANLEELTGQIARLQPEVVSVADARRADDLAQRLGEKGLARKPEIHHGREGMLAVATHSKADVVVSAAVGVVGLEATYE